MKITLITHFLKTTFLLLLKMKLTNKTCQMFSTHLKTKCHLIDMVLMDCKSMKAGKILSLVITKSILHLDMGLWGIGLVSQIKGSSNLGRFMKNRGMMKVQSWLSMEETKVKTKILIRIQKIFPWTLTIKEAMEAKCGE